MIEQYTLVIKTIQQFELDNAALLDEYKALQEAKNNFEQSLKIWAQENGDAENETVKVTVTPAYRKWYDPEILKKDHSAWILLRRAGAVTEVTEVDKKIADDLARDEKISRELLAQAYNEKALTPRISIKVK